MQQIDWSKAPDDATQGGQDEHWFYFYKDITDDGCKFFQVNKTNSNKSASSWQDTSGQPCAFPLFERPASRSKALSWCVDNIKKWPSDGTPMIELPCGWSWYGDTRCIVLRCTYSVDESDIQMNHWATARNTPPRSISLGYPPLSLAPLRETEAAIETLENLGYTYNGGQLWRPPLGPKPDFVDYDGWKAGDECWISNENGYELIDGYDEVLGFGIVSKVLSLFTFDNGMKMVTVENHDGLCRCFRLSMLKRPIPKCNFEHGKNVYTKNSKRLIGRYVGINPETGSVVTVIDAEFKTSHQHLVTQ